MKVFVDSSAFIALAIRNDQFHRPALEFAKHLSRETQFLTSNFVLDETLTHLNARLGPGQAFRFANDLLQSDLYEINSIDAALFHSAVLLLKKFGDKKLSFTDLTSFALMRAHGIRKAFSFDSDFTRSGFETVP